MDRLTKRQEEQREIWLEEQIKIAEQVQVLTDEHVSEERFSQLSLLFDKEKCLYVGGVDVSYSSITNVAVAVYVILQTPRLDIVYMDSEYFEVDQPYIPSFLAFRELPPLVRLLRKQLTLQPSFQPCVVLVDGNGIFHPRGAGLASALGVVTGLPTIGIGKTLYQEGNLTKNVVWCGMDTSLVDLSTYLSAMKDMEQDETEYWIRDNQCIMGAKEDDDSKKILPSRERRQLVNRVVALSSSSSKSRNKTKPKLRGLAIPLSVSDRGIVACALMAHGNIQHPTQTPIFISVGHLISLEEATRWTIVLSVQSRIPEPLRQADLQGRALLREKVQI